MSVSAEMTLKSMRYMARQGVGSITENSGLLRRAAAKSERNAEAALWPLRQVYYENALAGRHDVAAALAELAADICRLRGDAFELKLADALLLVAASRLHTGEPALAVLEESMAIMARHPSVAGGSYGPALALLAEVHHAAGRHTEAVDAAQQALDLEKRLGSANVPAAKLRLARVSG